MYLAEQRRLYLSNVNKNNNMITVVLTCTKKRCKEEEFIWERISYLRKNIVFANITGLL